MFCPCCAFGSAHGTVYSLNVFWIKDKPVLTKQNYQYSISPLKFYSGISLKYLFVCQPHIPMLQQHCEKVPWEVAGWYLKGKAGTSHPNTCIDTGGIVRSVFLQAQPIL